MRRRALAVGVALLLAGCLIDVDYGTTAFLCVEDPTCPPGLVCVDGVCRPPGDGGPPADAPVDADIAQQIEVAVAASADDAEEVLATTAIVLSSDSLELAVDDIGGDQVVGMRFAAVAIPPGSQVVAAHIQFSALEVTTGAPASLSVRAQAVDDAPGFNDVLADLSSRPTTAAAASWQPGDWPTAGERGDAERTTDLSPVIQEVIDRPGWASGQAIAILVTGQGRRAAQSFDAAAPGQPPALVVRFVVPASAR